MTYVPHTHSYNEGGETTISLQSASRVGIKTDLYKPAIGRMDE